MIEAVDLLGIAAHPDDIELGCAGTMLLAKRDGKRTAIVDLTRGELSTRGTLETRQRETDEATRILGLDYRANLGMPDGNIELSQENTLRLGVELRRLRPTVVLANSRDERHPDHEAAAELVHRASFYSGLAKIETRDESGVSQQPHRPLLTLHYMQSFAFEPSIIIDVTPVFEDRMRAVFAYASQFARPLDVAGNGGMAGKEAPVSGSDKPEPETFLSQRGFFDWLRARASSYGMMIGVEYGEPLWSRQPIGTKDLFSLVTKKIA